MLLPLLLLAQDKFDAARVYAEYRENTRVEVRCQRPKDNGEIIVCARREAYRYQTPLVTSGNRLNKAHAQDDIVWTADAQGHVECGKGAFLVRCGKVGPSVSVGSDGAVGYKLRDTPP